MITRSSKIESAIAAALFVLGVAIGVTTVHEYRAAGHRPMFYQENFAPAVMMACGYGFTMPAYAMVPQSLRDFALLQRDDFNCADFPPKLVTEKVTWNGTWFYLYGTVAMIWKVTGINWPVLDWLCAVLVAFSLTGLYALFRLVTGRTLAAIAAVVLTLMPANMLQMPMLRDFSKVPFVFWTIFVLASLVMRPKSIRGTLAFAALFGAVVGFGFGFRTDLLIMAPFGVFVIALFLPGSYREHWKRNVAAAVIAFASFLIVAAPPLRGLSTGGCQYHYSLLGLTTTRSNDLGVESANYAFGDIFYDTFIDLKVGDYAQRQMGLAIPNLCDPDYDRASGQLFFTYARTFPADLVVRAYAAALTVLRSGMQAPEVYGPLKGVRLLSRVLAILREWGTLMGLIGLSVTLAAGAIAWSTAPRLGIAFTAFVLFLTGYPAIEFESRHWFHLRFIPWWALLLLIGAAWRNPQAFRDVRQLLRGFVPVAGTLALMVLALGGFRIYQDGPAKTLAASYDSAPVERVDVAVRDGSTVHVDWKPTDVASYPAHRASDMLAITIETQGCLPGGPLDLRVVYDADVVTHDISTTIHVDRLAPGGPPTKVFFPVFMQGHLDLQYLKFAALETPGRSSDCVSSIARLADRSAVPLWVQMQLPPDWRERPFHQVLRSPAFIRSSQ